MLVWPGVLKLFFPRQSQPPCIAEMEIFLKCGYVTSHEKYSFSQQKTFIFISLTHSIWHRVPQSIALSLKMDLEQRKPRPGLKRDRNRYSQGIPGSTVTFFVLCYRKFLIRRLFFFLNMQDDKIDHHCITRIRITATHPGPPWWDSFTTFAKSRGL